MTKSVTPPRSDLVLAPCSALPIHGPLGGWRCCHPCRRGLLHRVFRHQDEAPRRDLAVPQGGGQEKVLRRPHLSRDVSLSLSPSLFFSRSNLMEIILLVFGRTNGLWKRKRAAATNQSGRERFQSKGLPNPFSLHPPPWTFPECVRLSSSTWGTCPHWRGRSNASTMRLGWS